MQKQSAQSKILAWFMIWDILFPGEHSVPFSAPLDNSSLPQTQYLLVL